MDNSIFISNTGFIFNDLEQYITAINNKNLIIKKPLLPNIKIKEGGIPIYHYSNLEGILSSTSDKIIIDLITENYHVFDNIKHNLPKQKKYYFFSNGFWDTSVDENLGLNFEILYFPYFISISIRFTILCHTKFWFDSTVTSSNNGKFCALIGVKKPWRDSLVKKLLEAGLQDNFITYNGKRLGNLNIDDPFLEGNYDSYAPYLNHDHFNISDVIPVTIFNATSFCLVFETNMYSFEEFHLSEKTVKCLNSGVPFVVASSYNFLKNLRNIGFKTYNELWDETYDDIVDASQRMDAITKLCKQLSTFDWEKNRAKINEIALHNFKVLFNSKDIFEPAIINIVRTLHGH